MKKYMPYNRILSAIMALAILFTLLPPYTLAVESADTEETAAPVTQTVAEETTETVSEPADDVQDFYIVKDGAPVDALTFNRNEKVTVSAVCADTGAEYQWQILLNDGVTWVDIYEETAAELTVSYPLVRSLLSQENTTALRCVAVIDGMRTAFTQPLNVTVDMTELLPADTASMEQAIQELTEEVDFEDEVLEDELLAEESAPMMFSLARNSTQDIAEDDTATVDETTDLVSVTIEYYYEDRDGNKGNMVMDPYVARIPENEPLNVTVACKVFPGYEIILVGDETDDGITLANNEITIALASVTADMTIEVRYKEVQVPYYARFFMQNVYNDLYTERTDVLTEDQKAAMVGFAGEQPDEKMVHPEIEGFTALFHQPDTIAADGSTVFEVYYDRNYYLVNFNLEGGFGTAPVYARYETSFTVSLPTRPGYTFAGWELESGTVSSGAETDSYGLVKKIQASDLTYRATWTQGDTDYTVAYWLEDPNEQGKYNYVSSEPINDVVSGTSVTALDYLTDDKKTELFEEDAPYILFDETKTTAEEAKQEYRDADGKVIVQGDGSTILNVYFTPKEYKLRFYYAAEIDNKYYVIGGAVSPFAKTNSNDEAYLLHNNFINSAGNRGQISELPSLNDTGIARKNAGDYTLGTTTYSTYSDNIYYYLEFSAKYGGDITKLWPVDVFESVAAIDKPSGSTYEAFASGWAGEYNVRYSQVNNGYTTGQSLTIKGKYRKLVRDLLFVDDSLCTDNTVCYISFYSGASTAGWSIPRRWIYEIYTPLLDGETGYTTVEKDDIIFKRIDTYNVYDTSEYGQEGNMPPIPMDGYTFVKYISTISDVSPSDCKQEITIQYYYTSGTYSISYQNYSQLLPTKELSYLDPINSADYYITPPYPDGDLEPNAYVFEGWYTSPEYLPTTKFYDSNGNYVGQELDCNASGVPLMPSSPISLNAYWKPVTYDTYFYLDYDRYKDPDEVYATVEDTSHGKNMVFEDADIQNKILYPKHDVGTDYQFIGWFYIDADGDKVAFNPSEMAVRQELHLYAEWSTKVVRQYTVSYKLGQWDETTKTVMPIEEGEDGYQVLSENTTGYAFEATTRTFTAKSEDQLEELSTEEKENRIWVPHTNSHSILMKADNDENVFTFWYISRESIEYTVRYLDATTGEPVIVDGLAKEDKTETTGEAVVTEQFVYVPGYIPDAFHKTLILSANEAENVIVFYYTKDESYEDNDDDGKPDVQSARYLVTHYIQDIGADTYSAYTTDDEIGIVGETVHAEVLTIPGFTFSRAEPNQGEQDGKTTACGTVTTGETENEALKLELYYTRNKYSYTVYYKNKDTGTEVRDAEERASVYQFNDTVTETAPDIVGYDLYGSETQTLKISATESLNTITFLYTQKALTVNYVPVCKTAGATDFGYVLAEVEYKTINGTTAIAKEGFGFVGWYSDESCTTELTTESHYKPTVSTDGGIYEYTFYALFEPVREDLVITVSGENLDAGDSFLFKVTGTDVLGQNVELMVSIQGADSVTVKDLYCGTYTVTELTGWSWTYSNAGSDSATETISSSDDVSNCSVSFTNAPKTVDWLHGETSEENPFTG